MQHTVANTLAALSISIATSLFYTSAIAQPEIANIRPEPSLSVQGATLVLNGAGLRSKFAINVYVATPSQEAATLINSQSPVACVCICCATSIAKPWIPPYKKG